MSGRAKIASAQLSRAPATFTDLNFRKSRNLRVAGNGVSRGTIILRGVAQLGRAPEWGSGGQRFKSALPDYLFCIAGSN